MRRLFLLLPTLILMLGTAHAGVTGTATVVDGDTIEVGAAEVRLAGIHAPETDQPHGMRATRALRALIGGKRVHPHCVPYPELPENVKEYDRVTARTVIEALKDEGYNLPRL